MRVAGRNAGRWRVCAGRAGFGGADFAGGQGVGAPEIIEVFEALEGAGEAFVHEVDVCEVGIAEVGVGADGEQRAATRTHRTGGDGGQEAGEDRAEEGGQGDHVS